MNEIELYNERTFESIKHIDEYGNEYWKARELQIALDYSKWENFIKVIDKAKTSCRESNNNPNNHFPEVRKMVKTGDSERMILDYHLSRYACYLIVQNADPNKKVVALGQTYFAIQTRKQELLEDEIKELSEDEKRLRVRGQVSEGNKSLNDTVHEIGIKTTREFAIFHNEGYKGLYNGETARKIKQRKNLEDKDDILDHMGSTELAANWFRITQTDEILKNDDSVDISTANKTHKKVGKEIRKTMGKLGGKMPEELPTPDKSLKQIEKEFKTKISNK